MQHQNVSTLRTDNMLRMAVRSIHQMALSVCVSIKKSYHVTNDSGGYLPDGGISLCLHYEQISCYVRQWRVSTRWQ